MAIDATERPVLAALLEENRRRLIAELIPRLRAFEERYEVRSEDLSVALGDGRVSDTADVCDWVIAWEAYRAIAPGSPRVE